MALDLSPAASSAIGKPPLFIKKATSYRTIQGKANKTAQTLVDFSNTTDPVTVIRAEKGMSYTLTDPLTGKVIEPKIVKQVGNALEIALQDGRLIRLEEFFVSAINSAGEPLLQAQSEYLFFTGQGASPFLLVDVTSNLAEWSLQTPRLIWPIDAAAGLYQWAAAIDMSGSFLMAAPVATGFLSGGLGAAVGGLGLALGVGGGGSSPVVPTASAPFFDSTTNVTVSENTLTTVAVYTAHAIPDVASKTIVYTLGGADALRFNLNATTGVVSFKAAPDADVPSDVGLNNVYNFIVTATDSAGLSTTQSVAITVQDLPDIGPVFTTSNSVVVLENVLASNAILTAIATPDVSGKAITYTLSGTDAALFTLDTSTGSLRFKDSPNHENPRDVAGGSSIAGNNVYDLIITATEAGNSRATSQSLQVVVQDVSDVQPVFASLLSVTVNENISGVAYKAVATPDVTGNSITYALTGGADLSKFSIDASGNITFKAPPDFENQTDDGRDNIYDIQVTASEAGGLSQVQNVAIKVLDVGDVPTFTTLNTVTVLENTATAVYTANATADTTSPLVYRLSTAGDSGLFNINATSGVVTFKIAPDYEAPTDIGLNNVYNLTVVATATTGSGVTTASHNVAITVQDIVGVQPLATATPLNGTLNLDVQSHLVLSLNTAVQLSTNAALKIKIVHDGGVGFHADASWTNQAGSHGRDFEISLTDTSQVTLSVDGRTLTINPKGDLDFGSNYHIEIDAGAFINKADSTNPVASAAMLNGIAAFSTVLPNATVAGQASQKMAPTGGLVASQSYIDIEGRGNFDTVNTALDLGSGGFTLVYKDYASAVGTDTVTGIGTGTTGFNLQVKGFGSDDRLYFDDQSLINALSANRLDSFGNLQEGAVGNTPSTGNVPNYAGVLQIDPGSVGAPHAWIGVGLQNPLYDFNSSLTTLVISA